MNEAIITGLFSLVGALIGAFVSLIIYSKTMKKNIQLEIQKISLQKEADLSIRLFDKQEAYMAELLSVLSITRNAAIDVIELGLTDETETLFKRSQEVASKYLNRYEKTNILYLSESIRHEAAQLLTGWRHIDRRNINKDICKLYKHNIENFVEDIKVEINRELIG